MAFALLGRPLPRGPAEQPARRHRVRQMPQLWARFPCRLGERHGGADIKGGHISQKQRLNAAPAQEALNFRPVRVMIKPPREGQNVRRAFEGRAANEAGVEAGQINISGPYPEHVQAVPGCRPSLYLRRR